MLVNMGRIFQQNALRFAEKPAVINVERKRRFTYARMHELTNRVCNLLKHRFGLGRGDFYATILHNDNMACFTPGCSKARWALCGSMSATQSANRSAVLTM